MPNSRLSVEEAEQPAKVWQVNELKDAVESLEKTVKNRMDNTPTIKEMHLELEKRDAAIDDLHKKWSSLAKVTWTFVSTFVTAIAGAIIHLLGRGT